MAEICVKQNLIVYHTRESIRCDCCCVADHVLITHARLDPTRPIMDQDPYYTAAVGGDTVRIELDSNGAPNDR